MKAPKVVRRVEPRFPRELLGGNYAGSIRIRCIIQTDGHATDIAFVSGDTQLFASVRDAVQKWQFQPGTLDGKPVPVVFEMTTTMKSGR